MIEGVLELPTHLRRRLADALDAGHLTIPCGPIALQSVLGTTQGGEDTSRGLAALADLGLNERAVSAWLRTLDGALAQRTAPDLVWSGPEVPGVHARNTRRVYEEVLGSAEHSIWASSYAYFDGPRAFEVMSRRMDECPSLQVTLLLNLQRKRGDEAPADHLVRRFADRFWKRDWPGQRRPAVYFDPRSLDPDGPAGVLHAKAGVADDEAVFVTSANLTEAALDRNIELGVLVRDRALALSVTSHLRGLIERGMLELLPSY